MGDTGFDIEGWLKNSEGPEAEDALVIFKKLKWENQLMVDRLNAAKVPFGDIRCKDHDDPNRISIVTIREGGKHFEAGEMVRGKESGIDGEVTGYLSDDFFFSLRCMVEHPTCQPYRGEEIVELEEDLGTYQEENSVLRAQLQKLKEYPIKHIYKCHTNYPYQYSEDDRDCNCGLDELLKKE